MTDVFDDMLRRSIPDHDGMRAAVAELATSFVQGETTILDLGCSRGEALASVRTAVRARRPKFSIDYSGFEVSPPMLDAARARFEGAEDVEVSAWDLRSGFPRVDERSCSVVLSVLTLQFVPVTCRQRVIDGAFESLVPGGALLLVEKILGADAHIDATFVDLYHQRKRANGYSAEEVVRKAAALEGVLVPLKRSWNEDMLRTAGFSSIDCFWRWMNFAGWVAVR